MRHHFFVNQYFREAPHIGVKFQEIQSPKHFHGIWSLSKVRIGQFRDDLVGNK